MKKGILDWCKWNEKILKRHYLFGTGTTSLLISGATGLKVFSFKSGPYGGDQQIGAAIVEGKLDILIFFCDPLTAQPHDTDVKALLRIAQVYDIPMATNRSTADFIITSLLMDEPITYAEKVKNSFSVTGENHSGK